jgi:choice-of-anchor B domain-containing protein
LRPQSFKLLILALLIAFATFFPASADDNIQNFYARNNKSNFVSQSLGTTEQAYILDSLWAFQFGTFNGSDCWGYTAPDSQQYAIMGIHAGIVIVNATTFQIIDTVTGSGCLWQDIKTLGHYCYTVSECGSGLRVIDLQYLPDSAHLVGIFPTSGTGSMSSHNISLDTTTGFLYLEGSGGAGNNIHIQDLSNPENPTYVSSFGPNSGDIHDMFAENDTVYVAEGNAGTFSIYDATDKFNVQRLLVVGIPASGYVHNIWPTEDRKYVITTEETTDKTVKVWDVQNFLDIRLLGEYLAPNGMAHNAHVLGNFVYLSHYESGTRVLDISNPECPLEVAYFDQPGDDIWGTYPYTNDSLVFSSDLNGTLYILKIRENPAYVGDDPDGDGHLTPCDNCPAIANVSQANSDADSYGDACDNCPENANASQANADGDNLGDVCDNCPSIVNNSQIDSDDDTFGDACDNCPDIINYGQLDIDSDDVGDSCDNCLNQPNTNQNNSDSDSYGDACDNCPDQPNEDQTDSDGDGYGDACDACPGYDDNADSDGDGVADSCDGCPATYNANQIDSDSDGVQDSCDNCPTNYNPGQEDLDSDGRGDVCCCIGLVGDFDGNGSALPNILDLNYLVNYIFRGGTGTVCFEEGNINSDGQSANILDLNYLVNYIFRGGELPLECPGS